MTNHSLACARPAFAWLALAAIILGLCAPAPAQTLAVSSATQTPAPRFEYLWYEAENMRGFATNERNEPRLYPGWLNLPPGEITGWAMNGPGVSAEWSQGGESEWNSAAAGPYDTRAAIHQDVEISRAGAYRFWVRYADWARKSENFVARITQGGREVFRHEFGARERIDPHDEVSMYWGWAFAWDGAAATLEKGAARISIEIERAAEARRHVDCFLLTNDLDFTPAGREKPEFAAWRVLREWRERAAGARPASWLAGEPARETPDLWRRQPLAGRDFLMPWNIAPEFWAMYARPPAERPLYPFHAEQVEAFVATYSGARDVPIFSSRLVVPVIYINSLPDLLREGSPFLRYLRETRAPFAVLINYGTAQMSEEEGRAAWALLTGELREQFLGWVSGESIGYVWPAVAATLRLTPSLSRREMLEAYRAAYTRALEGKWGGMFHAPTGPMWEQLIVAQATSSTAYAHALGRWGSRLLGMETPAVQPNTAMRIAFTRGAARQYGRNFLYYHAPNFGDTATTFTQTQNFAGPNHFFHTRYGATMGPSLTWYRKSYYLYYMAGASAIYLEQGYDQFFRPGPGEHPFQLNPLGRITDEFMRFVARHPERGTPYTPIAFLLDPAHGWDMTDYPQWPFGVAQIERGDQALRELFGTAYYPAPVTEGEPATADRQVFVNSIFGDIFDVLVASEERAAAINAYRALIVGGRIEWPRAWAGRLRDYARAGGTVVVNAAQTRGLTEELLGVRLSGQMAEADEVRGAATEEAELSLRGQVFRYERVTLRGATVLLQAPTGEPLVTSNRVGNGRVIFCAIPDLLGLDDRMTPAGAYLLARLAADATPVRVRGDAQYLINRTARGWVVTLFNTRGVLKPQQGLAQVDRSAEVEVALDLRGSSITQAREWTDDTVLEVTRDGDAPGVRLRIPAGGIRIVELLSSDGQ